MQTSDTIGRIAQALAKAQGEFVNPVRNRTVTVKSDRESYEFAYATFDTILDMARPVLARHGLAFMQTVSRDGTAVRVTTRLLHASGEWVEDAVAAPAERAGLQALGSATTYLKRYALTAMLGIAADEDDDANAAEGNHADSSDRTPTQHHHEDAAHNPYAIPLRPNPSGHGGDWKAWRESVVQRLSGAKDVAEVDGIMSAIAAPLDKLKTTAPKSVEAIRALAESRRDHLTQDSSEKAA